MRRFRAQKSPNHWTHFSGPKIGAGLQGKMRAPTVGAHVFRHKLGPLLVQKSGTRIWDLLCYIRQCLLEQALAAFWWSPVVSSALRRHTQRNTWCLRQGKAQPLRVTKSFAVKAMYILFGKAAVNKKEKSVHSCSLRGSQGGIARPVDCTGC